MAIDGIEHPASPATSAQPATPELDGYMKYILEQIKAGEDIRIPAEATKPPLESLGQEAERYMALARRNGIKVVNFSIGTYKVSISDNSSED